MKQNVTTTLSYFSQFSYPATLHELYTFHPHALSKLILQKQLDILIHEKTVKTIQINSIPRYILVSTKGAQHYQARYSHSLNLTYHAKHYLKFLALIPFIQYLGISGSLSMLNAAGSSDIDIFMITTPGTRWMVRFMVLTYKKMLSLLNMAFGSKLCFNLIFAQDGLAISKKKQTEYIGHEILQLKCIFNKSQTYEMLLKKNPWVLKLFPNVYINSSASDSAFRLSKQSYLTSILEGLVRDIQIWWLDRKGYTYGDEGNQLWLIQKDYEDELL